MNTFGRNLFSTRGIINVAECQLRRQILQQSESHNHLATRSVVNCATKLKPQELHSANVIQQLQVRKYAPTVHPTTARACWNCDKITESESNMICAGCGYLQDVNLEINYFDLLKFPKSFQVEPQELTKRFRQLQTLVHPDKYSNKTTREQTNSADWSSLINKAYKTLSVPIDRGEYMLELHGKQLPQDNSALDKEFLLEMMERNEEVQAAETREKLLELNARITEEINEKISKLSAEFESEALDAAKMILVQMKYLLSIQNSIRNKLQTMTNS